MAPIPAYASAIIILFSVLLPAVCWLGVHSAALPADRRLVSGVTGLFLGAWVLAALALCIAGEFHPGAAKLIPGRSNSAPFLGSALAIALILFLAVAPFRRTLDDVANSWLVAAQVGRVMGFLGPIDIQDSHRESVLIHCASDQLIRSAAHGEAIRAQRPAVGAYR